MTGPRQTAAPSATPAADAGAYAMERDAKRAEDATSTGDSPTSGASETGLRMDDAQHLAEALTLINGLQWQDPEFSIRKAYACCLFAELAYKHVPALEIETSGRFKAVPSQAYQEIVKAGTASDVGTVLHAHDFGQFFTLVRRFAVVVGVRTSMVTVIAIRGTRELYDWLTNLNTRRIGLDWNGQRVHFHRGFFRAIYSCFQPMSSELLKLNPAEAPVYVTGHSVGGALAAIANATWVTTRDTASEPKALRPHSCYVFGMPRYGNLTAMLTCREPFHVYNEKDIVPTVPPRWLGFDGCTREHTTDGTALEKKVNLESLRFAEWILRLGARRSPREHDIELYRERIRTQLGSGW